MLVLPDVLHALRSFLCTATNATPHELFFNFYRKSCCGFSLPSWLSEPGPVLLRNFVRTQKNDDLVQKVYLTEANPTFARVRFPDGRESTVALKDLAPCPSSSNDSQVRDVGDVNVNQNDNNDLPEYAGDVTDFSHMMDINGTETSHVESVNSNNNGDPSRVARRSTRINKGVPPIRYGAPVSY